MSVKGIFVFSIGLMVGAFSTSALRAQTGPSTSEGVYTAAQAARGHAIYAARCSSCHLDDLTGSEQNPPLAGESFLTDWSGMTLSALFDKIKSSMPADHPGSLSPQQTADVVAFLLSANKFPAGKTELSTDSARLRPIHIDTPPAGHAPPPAPPK